MTERRFRFAPSPNGELHLGHAYSALLNRRLAHEAGGLAHEAGGRLLVRMEDIDPERCRPEFEAGIMRDLAWLGILPDEPVRRQSEHPGAYRNALDELRRMGLVYPAFLTRGEIRKVAEAQAAATGRSILRDPDGAPLYPGTDRALPESERAARIAAGAPFAWRLDMGRAIERAGALAFEETGSGMPEIVKADPAAWGDVVVARADVPTSYHLAVVVDDALQGITDVVRGRDLFAATAVHRVLQALLGLPAPRYHHHALILDEDGRKLSKSADDVSLASLRDAGWSPAEVARRVGL